MSFSSGALVRARGREWVVLPDSSEDLLLLRPLGGTDDETTGILPDLEQVEPARFDWPNPNHPGDHRSARLLRDALRLGFRSSAGPFRSFGSIAVEPRPYQLVPLLMALRQDPARLLIADDVGVGKTVEALLIAAELLATGAAGGLAVLCPPHLAEQWQREMADKFHLNAELVLPSTARRLERRRISPGQSLFDLYPHVVVSTDFIKTDARRTEFVHACPDLVIVDEAHTCAADPDRRGARHQRHELVSALATDPARHLLLVTATPHSGNEGAFRSLLALLAPDLADLPEDVSGEANASLRRRVAQFLVQRRRTDVERLLDTTAFPKRDEPSDETYTLHEDYRRLFDRALSYARETVRDTTGGAHRQRVRWWSALALLRSLASSPAAAAATLRNRAETAETATVEEADALGRRTVLDAADDESVEATDTTLGANPTVSEDKSAGRVHKRLLEMARLADDLAGARDHKLARAKRAIDDLLAAGFTPIVFCRFIPTAEYVANHLRTHVGDRAEVVAVTGSLPPADREQRILDLARHPHRVLVATDCLSEGVNLQEHFDAVVHYDLSWNPTRHEQREGRVDRYGQPRDLVKIVTMYGTDNAIDGIILDVLLRKHRRIRKTLGIAVPVPVGTAELMEAIFEGLLLRERTGSAASGEQLALFDDVVAPKRTAMHASWDAAAARERRAGLFAQQTIKVDEVSRELAAARDAVGSATDVAAFVKTVVSAHGGHVADAAHDAVDVFLTNTPTALRDAVGGLKQLRVRFDLPVRDGETYLPRTHPIVEGLASHVLTSALDELTDSPAARAGCIRTRAVDQRTTLLLLRCRFDIATIRRNQERVLLAEDTAVLALTGAATDPTWLDPAAIPALLAATPHGNIAVEQAIRFLSQVIEAAPTLDNALAVEAQRRANQLLAAHRRVRTEAGLRGVRYRVSPHLPVDVLGAYVLLPQPNGSTA